MHQTLQALRFLVIDDSGFMRKMVRQALESFGVTNIEEATDAVEGLKVLQDASNHIDFVLVDQEMPVLDGLDFTRLVRKDKALPNPSVPIVMVTALANKQLFIEARKAGVNAFVAKPFSPKQLGKHVQAVLDSMSPNETSVSDEPCPLKELTVLLIDDSGVARKIAKQILGEIDITKVFEADDGATAVTILQEKSEEIGMILVDREMPVIDGIEFTQMLRSSESLDYSDMPIIMVSGLSAEAQIAEARDAGVTSFVAKPYEPKELKHQIQFAIRDPRPFNQH